VRGPDIETRPQRDGSLWGRRWKDREMTFRAQPGVEGAHSLGVSCSAGAAHCLRGDQEEKDSMS
jgi:hypothetical protein